jgi:hypothetical protein
VSSRHTPEKFIQGTISNSIGLQHFNQVSAKAVGNNVVHGNNHAVLSQYSKESIQRNLFSIFNQLFYHITKKRHVSYE